MNALFVAMWIGLAGLALVPAPARAWQPPSGWFQFRVSNCVKARASKTLPKRLYCDTLFLILDTDGGIKWRIAKKEDLMELDRKANK